VISDLVMPRMNGSELITRIRVLKPSVKVVLMSGYTAYPGGQAPRIPTGVPFLQKPFTTGRLAAVVRAALDAADTRTTGRVAEPAA
jgi:DNA-binding NtrC family response regulator